MIILLYEYASKFGLSDPPISGVDGEVLSYNIKFIDNTLLSEEFGVCLEDGLKVKINGAYCLKTLEWLSEEEAVKIGKMLIFIVFWHGKRNSRKRNRNWRPRERTNVSIQAPAWGQR